MIDWLKNLLGGSSKRGTPSPAGPVNASPSIRGAENPAKPPLPDEMAKEFLDWYSSQRKPAISLAPDPSKPIAAKGSRLFGPAWITAGEDWPVDLNGVPLELVAQLDLADLRALRTLPETGLLQFFIGRDDLYGADLDDLVNGNFLVRHVSIDTLGTLHPVPPLEMVGEKPFSDYSPSQDDETRARGVAVVAELFDDHIDLSIKEALERFEKISNDFDLDDLYSRIDEIDARRPLRHHVGGFPAFTQTDIRYAEAYSDYDCNLLRLTSDEFMMWGDVGECVFMIRSDDLAKGDFSKVAYSWDCH